VDGVADVGFALSAWFVDPGGNAIGLLQFKEEAGLSRRGKLDGELGSSPEGADGPVTTMTRRVKPGHEPFCERFLEGIIAAAIEFPGHLGVEVFGPEAAISGEYRVVYRFDTREHLQAWLDSDERAVWLGRAEPHLIGPMRTQVLTGLETWFTLPGRAAGCIRAVRSSF
jgi:heme-degrading monooxygenase HmoA